MTDPEVQAFLERVTPERRRRDALTMLGLMRRVTGQEPRLWGSIVAFGQYHYRYASGREGDAPAAAFAPRKSALTVYLNEGVGAHAEHLAALGPHTTGKGCLYIKDLDEVDVDVLEEIVADSYSTLTAGTFPSRARGLEES